jgi:peroxiredoxin
MPLARTKIKVGDPAPDVFLPAANGQEVSLRAALLEGPVLVEFIRGTWCPSARKRLDELSRARAAFRDARTRVLVVAGEDPPAARRYFSEHPTPLTILLDGARRVARSFGVYQRFGLGAWNVARPASFLIDRAGFVRLVFVARLPVEAVPVEEILSTIGRLGEEGLKLRERRGPG